MKCILNYVFKASLATLCLPLAVSAAEISTRIVGGEESALGQFPWAVSLKYSATQQHFCGASLIGEQWVLTAAHCLVNSGISKSVLQITASVGEYDLYSIPVTPAKQIEQFYIHPGYNSATQVNDIALLKLVSAVDTPSLITPVNLDITKSAVANQENVTALGWGSTVAYAPDQMVIPDPDYPNILNYVEIPLMTDTMCSSVLGSNYTAEMICAGLQDGGKDSCQGDSGGPLVIKQDGSWQQIGIVSWGNGCAASGYPGVYTRLALYEEWVNSVSKSIYFPNRLEFQDTLIGSTHIESVVIENNSTYDAQLDFSASGDATFAYDASDCAFIAHNDSCELLISYSPSDSTPSQKTISISSDVMKSQQTLSLIGLPLIDATELAAIAGFQLDNMAWFSGGYSPWQFNAKSNYLQSGSIAADQNSFLKTTVKGTGKLSFDWAVQSEREFDKLTLSINGTVYSSISGLSGFATKHVYLDKAVNQVVWNYEKNATITSFADQAYLDNVTFEKMTKEAFDLWLSQINVSSSSGGGAIGWLTVLLFPLLFIRRFHKFL
ncbi:MAG TPA: trypsin-like serine protease [Psychromonas sp.]